MSVSNSFQVSGWAIEGNQHIFAELVSWFQKEKLVPIGDPTGETTMFSFPGSFEASGASGALVISPIAKPGVGGTLVYFSVKDCAQEESRVTKFGGQVIRPKFSIGEFGYVSICQDTEGNFFGLNSME